MTCLARSGVAVECGLKILDHANVDSIAQHEIYVGISKHESLGAFVCHEDTLS